MKSFLLILSVLCCIFKNITLPSGYDEGTKTEFTLLL
jgi:hypothetical protein